MAFPTAVNDQITDAITQTKENIEGIRWYVERREWKQWDDRDDKWYPCHTESEPVLQIKIGGKWKKVETYVRVHKT